MNQPRLFRVLMAPIPNRAVPSFSKLLYGGITSDGDLLSIYSFKQLPLIKLDFVQQTPQAIPGPKVRITYEEVVFFICTNEFCLRTRNFQVLFHHGGCYWRPETVFFTSVGGWPSDRKTLKKIHHLLFVNYFVQPIFRQNGES